MALRVGKGLAPLNAPLLFLFLANLKQGILACNFYVSSYYPALYFISVSRDPVMGVTSRDRIDWACPLGSFSNAEAWAEALSEMGVHSPSFLPPQHGFGTLRKKRTQRQEAKGAGFFQSCEIRRLVAAKTGKLQLYPLWYEGKTRPWAALHHSRGTWCQEDDIKDVQSDSNACHLALQGACLGTQSMGPKWDLYTTPSLKGPWNKKSARTKTYLFLILESSTTQSVGTCRCDTVLIKWMNECMNLSEICHPGEIAIIIWITQSCWKDGLFKALKLWVFSKSILIVSPHLDTLNCTCSPDNAVHRILGSSHLGVCTLTGSFTHPFLVIGAAVLHHRTEFSKVWLCISFEKDRRLWNWTQRSHSLLTARMDSHTHSRKC